ncbi:MAG: peptidase [Deltaproteobacteria bacterium]|nr:MAG: peptidase [Deltaproteobacteria bacterium]
MQRTVTKLMFVLTLVLTVSLIGVGFIPYAHAKTTLVPVNFTELAKAAKPGVVNIRTVKTIKGGGRVFRHFFGRQFGEKNPFEEFFGPMPRQNPGQPPGQDPGQDFKQRSLGSGFIIDREGFIVTNNHVIEGADEITVKIANGKEYDAEIVGRDPSTDLALIKIKPRERLTPLVLGDSDALEVGNWVVAIGSPFGLEQTVTAGIVSAKGRTIGSGPYDDFIQTDASINFGNSGGPLINMQGEVIGINTAITATGHGIGFAIPSSLAKDVLTQLRDKGEVTRGWLGVGIQDLDAKLADYYNVDDGKGALITQVFKGDPADKAGIKVKDVIVAVDGHQVSSSRDLTRLIANTPVGKKTDITVIRDGRKKTFTVTLSKRETDKLTAKKEKGIDQGFGFRVNDLTPEIARRFGFSEDESGVVVVQVDSGGTADKAGLQAGDLIKEVNRKPVESASGFADLISAAEKTDTVQLLVKSRRGGFRVIKLEK